MMRFASDTGVVGTTVDATATTLKWPPPRSQLVRMMDPDADYDEPETGGVMPSVRSTAGDYYYDDHHVFAEGSTSSSPHLEGYQEPLGRIDFATRVSGFWDLYC